MDNELVKCGCCHKEDELQNMFLNDRYIYLCADCESKPVFDHTSHKALWNWLAENPDCEKEDWPGWDELGYNIDNGCFACDYVGWERDCSGSRAACHKLCPLSWSGTGCLDNVKNSPYDDWCENEYDKKIRVASAIAIRDLAVKEGVVCK